MTFDEWFVKYPLPAEIDTMDDTDREQWTWALRSAYKTGAAAQRQPLTDEEIDALPLPPSGAATVRDLVRIIEAAHGITGEKPDAA